MRRVPRSRFLALRHGLKNLSRPGAHVASVLVALGLGVGVAQGDSARFGAGLYWIAVVYVD